MPPDSKLPDDLDEIAGSMPRLPRAYSALRQLMALLPNPLAARTQGSFPVDSVNPPEGDPVDASQNIGMQPGTTLMDNAINMNQLADGAVTGAAFAATIRPVILVHGLPALPNASYPIDSFVYDIDAVPKTLWKNVADVWTRFINGATEIVADSITAGQIAAGAISTSELAIGARLTGEVANETGVTPGVFIDSTGILIRSGKLTLQDEFGLTTLFASGFDGSWADFISFGLYNGAFTDGKVAAGSIATGRTADLPYWTLTTGSTQLYERQYDNLKPMLRLKWSGLGTATPDSDKVPVYPKDLLELCWTHKFNRTAGTLTIQPYIYWYKADGSASATTFTICAGEQVTASTTVARGPADVVEVPADAALAKVKLVCTEAGTHNAANSIDLYSVSLTRKESSQPPATRHADAFVKSVNVGSGTVNDYDPGSIDTISLYQLDASGGVLLTGLIAPRYGKRSLYLFNRSAQDIVLAHQHASSSAANRFYIAGGQPLTLRVRGVLEVYYDDIGSWWVPVIAGTKKPIVQVYSATQTWTPTADLVRCQVRAVGAGGGGGGVDNTGAGQAAVGAGGGGGGYAEKWFSKSELPASVTITVGAGGGGGGASGGAGAAGAASSFAGAGITTVQGNGGGGGEGASAGSGYFVRAGGAGGTSAGSDLGINGSDGGNGISWGANSVTVQGFGGGSQLAGDQRASVTNAGGAGVSGHSYGGGGSGAHNTPSQGTGFAGGDGADGVVVVTEYYDP